MKILLWKMKSLHTFKRNNRDQDISLKDEITSYFMRKTIEMKIVRNIKLFRTLYSNNNHEDISPSPNVLNAKNIYSENFTNNYTHQHFYCVDINFTKSLK